MIAYLTYSIARRFKLHVAELRGPGRASPRAAKARLCLLLAARRLTFMSAVEIGRELNLNPSSVDAGMLKAAQLEQRVPMFAESVAAICARAKLKGAA